MKKIRNAVIILALLFSAGCRHAPVIPESPAISFQNEVQPIIAANCQMSGCHGAGEDHPRPLITYSDVINNGRIEPYNAHGSDFYERVIGAPFAGLMPPSPYNKLSQDQLLKIYLWIMQGANNN